MNLKVEASIHKVWISALRSSITAKSLTADMDKPYCDGGAAQIFFVFVSHWDNGIMSCYGDCAILFGKFSLYSEEPDNY